MYLIFILIINLTSDFGKYNAIPSQLKKTYAQIPSPPKNLENTLNVFIPILLEWVIHVSKDSGFDLQVETVHYLIEFKLYDLRQIVQIFTAVSFKGISVFSLQL